MSEIKSTLDLVMERTKNLTMSETEKQMQQQSELKKRMAGLLQRYLDQAIRPSDLAQQLEELKENYGPGAKKIMIAEILKDIRVDGDDTLRLALVREHFNLDVSALEKIIADCNQTLDAAKNIRIEKLKRQLSDRYGISGAAVIPNLETDPGWRQELRAITERFHIKLENAKKKLMAS